MFDNNDMALGDAFEILFFIDLKGNLNVMKNRTTLRRMFFFSLKPAIELIILVHTLK
jgi:hypothetical protein